MNDTPIRHTKARESSGVPLSGDRRRHLQRLAAPRHILRAFLIAGVIVLMLNPVAVMQTASLWRVGAVEDRMYRAAESWRELMVGFGLDEPGNAVRDWMRAREDTQWEQVAELVSPFFAPCRVDTDLRGSLASAPEDEAGGHDFAAKQRLNLNPMCYLRGLIGD